VFVYFDVIDPWDNPNTLGSATSPSSFEQPSVKTLAGPPIIILEH
jgi:hypothetical protein